MKEFVSQKFLTFLSHCLKSMREEGKGDMKDGPSSFLVIYRVTYNIEGALRLPA